MLLGFCVLLLVVLQLQYCILEDSPTKCEMCDIFICVRGMCGRNLVGRNIIGTELLMSVLQAMKKLNLADEPIRKFSKNSEFHWVATWAFI